jgi:hypothetical protein
MKKTNFYFQTFIIITFLLLVSSNLKAQDTLVSWTFPSESPDSLVDVSISINAAAYISAKFGTPGSPSYHPIAIDFNTNGSLGAPDKAGKIVGWDNGVDSAYIMISFKTPGYQFLTISSKLSSGGANPGPKYFRLQYRTVTTGIWQNVNSDTITVANDWVTGAVADVSLPADCENQASDMDIRWLMISDTNATGGIVGPAGIIKVDDILIKGIFTVGINNLTKENDIKIYPNPTNGQIQINGIQTNSNLKIMNSLGETVYSIETNNNTENIDLSSFAKGMYFIQLIDKENSKSHQFKIVLE